MSDQTYTTEYGDREFVPLVIDGKDIDPQPIPGETGQIVAVSVTYNTVRTAMYLFPADWTQEQIVRNLEAGFDWVGQFEVHDQEDRFVSSEEEGYEHGDWSVRIMEPEGDEA